MSEEEIIRNVKRIIEYKVISNYINNNDSRAIEGLLDLYYKQQKEIEEKTTIVLAGAEKVKQLEKEIEEYKEIVECIEEFKRLKRPLMELVHEMNKFEDEFISKDKIREILNDERKKAKERINKDYNKKSLQINLIDRIKKILLGE